jgi:hypothetical protein
MVNENVAEQSQAPDLPQPNSVILEIRMRFAKLDRVDEIVASVNFMRNVVEG